MDGFRSTGIDKLPDHWVMYFNGSNTLKGVGADTLKYAIQLEYSVTNNITEYEGLVNGLRLAKDLATR
jgi:ribonuclease HI